MNTTRDFTANGTRYFFDAGPCTAGKGYAQFDTGSDAHYFGNWINPFEFKIVSYVEGDIIYTECDDKDEFVTEVKRMAQWHNDNDRFIGLDPGFNEDLKNRLTEIGLGEMI